MFKKIDNVFLYLFFLCIFFLKIPSFYILPFLKNNFLTSQALARVLIILIFIFNLIKFKFNLRIKNKQKILFILITAFFILQTFSLFYSINILSFWSRYKDVLISFLGFFLFYFYKQHKEKIIKIFLISIFFNLIYQFLFSFGFTNFLKLVIYDKHFDLAYEKLIRQQRLYTDTYDETMIPFLFTNLNTNLVVNFALFLGIIFFSFYSNIRSRFLMMLFSLFVSLFFLRKQNFKENFLIFFSFFLIIFLVTNLSFLTSSVSIFDRLFLVDEIKDVSPVNFRLNQIKKSIEVANQTLFGVGLGNYFDFLESNEKFGQGILARSDILNIGAREYIHNIFGLTLSEVGWVGFFIFILILFNFIVNDIKTIKLGKDIDKAIIFSFWSLFLYGLFNPAIPLSYQFLFWGLRGLIL